MSGSIAAWARHVHLIERGNERLQKLGKTQAVLVEARPAVCRDCLYFVRSASHEAGIEFARTFTPMCLWERKGVRNLLTY